MNALQTMVKLAKSNPSFLTSVIQMAKTAADGESKTRFDESVPATDMPKEQDPYLQQGGGRVPQAGDQSQASEGNMQYPDDSAAFQSQQQGDPGTMAAQSFIGPEVFQAAMSGDPNAIKLISQTAAAIATATSQQPVQQDQQPDMSQMAQQAGVTPEEYEAMMQTGQMPGGEQQQTAAPMPTPEEQVANQIIAPQSAPPAASVQPTMPEDKPVGGVPKKQPAKSEERKFGEQANKQAVEQEKVSSINIDDLISLVGILHRN